MSPLCHEPRVALAVLYELLAPYLTSGQAEIVLRCQPIHVETTGDRVRAVTVRDQSTGEDATIQAPYVLDATELGDLLPMAGAEHVTGAESQSQTGEPHALPEADPLDQQAITACFALDYVPGEDHTIERPSEYRFWRNYKADFWPGPQLGWKFIDPITLDVRRQAIFEGTSEAPDENLWNFRRIFYHGHYPRGRFAATLHW